MKRKLLFMLFGMLAVLILCTPSTAANLAKAWSITPYAGGYAFDDDENLDPAVVYGVRVGYNITQEWSIEAAIDYAEADGD